MTQPKQTQNWTSDESIYLLRTLTDLRSHYNSLISSNYQDSLKLLDMLNETRSKWLDESVANTQLRTTIERLERQNNEITNQIQKLNDALRHAETQIATLLSQKNSLESELREYKDRFEQLQHVLKVDQSDPTVVKLTRLNLFRPIKLEETSSDSNKPEPTNVEDMETEIESSTLKTIENTRDDGVRARSGGRLHARTSKQPRKDFHNRRSKSQQAPAKRSRGNFINENMEDESETMMEESPSPPKRSKETGKITATTVLTIDAKGKQPSKAKVTIRRSLNRSVSESNLLDEKPNRKTPLKHGLSTYDMRSPMPGFGNSWTNGQAIELRQHNFKPYSSMIANCDVCNKFLSSFRNNALRCTDCHLRFHADCLRPAPVPCLPRVETPKTPKKQRPRLQDFCPNQHPMIPPLLIHCVIALERDRLNFEGIYRIPGSESRVEKLLSELKVSKISPNLTDYDTETITSCIKRFLKDLRDPLIPTTSWSEFVQAAESDSDDQLNYAILELPAPNRDTLAYMCMHWQNVAKNDNANRMPIENLALCLGPTVVGFSKQSNLRMGEAATKENNKQVLVMKRLLNMPQEYWKRFIEHNIMGNNTPSRTPRTPLNLRSGTQGEAFPNRDRVVRHIDFAADQSFLGPVTKTPPLGGLVQPIARRPAGKYHIEKPY